MVHNITSKPNCQDSATQAKGERKYSTLSAQEKENVEKILFLLDKFCVGDSFYHEISMITDSLPRSYLVKQCRDELNKMCKIEPLNAKFEGAKVTCVETVFKIHISDFFKQNSDFDAQSLLYLLTVLRSLRNIELLYEDRCLKMQPPAIGSFD